MRPLFTLKTFLIVCPLIAMGIYLSVEFTPRRVVWQPDESFNQVLENEGRWILVCIRTNWSTTDEIQSNMITTDAGRLFAEKEVAAFLVDREISENSPVVDFLIKHKVPLSTSLLIFRAGESPDFEIVKDLNVSVDDLENHFAALSEKGK